MSVRYLVTAAMSLAVLLDDRVAWAQTPDGRLETRDGGQVFVYTMTGDSRQAKWAVVEVNNADGSRKCEWLKKLDAKRTYRFECPLTVAAGDKVPLRVRIFKDAKLSDRELFVDPVVNVTADVLAAAAKAGAAPAADVITVPDGVLEAAELPLPSTFKPTWYRRIEKGFSMRAYENSGDLTVEADALVFVDGKKTVRIAYSQIESVRWEPLDNDIANHWVAVRFTNDEGKPDGVAFRDGGMMGIRKGGGMIYATLHRAAKK
jgi:hypothetical protein